MGCAWSARQLWQMVWHLGADGGTRGQIVKVGFCPSLTTILIFWGSAGSTCENKSETAAGRIYSSAAGAGRPMGGLAWARSRGRLAETPRAREDVSADDVSTDIACGASARPHQWETPRRRIRSKPRRSHSAPRARAEMAGRPREAHQ